MVDDLLSFRQGTLIIRQLCVLLDAVNIYKVLAAILEGETDLEFVTKMVQVVIALYILYSVFGLWSVLVKL